MVAGYNAIGDYENKNSCRYGAVRLYSPLYIVQNHTLHIVQNHGQIEISHENLVKCRDLWQDRCGLLLHFRGISDKINWLYYCFCVA